MWYILILYFAGVFFWNMYIKEYDDDCEIEMIIAICLSLCGCMSGCQGAARDLGGEVTIELPPN